MAWFDELSLPGSEVTGWFAFVTADGPDEDPYPDVVPASGTVTFTPTATAVRVGEAWIGISPVTARVFEGEIVVSEADLRPVRILSTEADTGVEGWGWVANFNIAGASIKRLPFRAPASGVHLTSNTMPITGSPVELVSGKPGPPGASVVAFRDTGEGSVVLVLEDGTESPPVPLAEGPAGPPNRLSIGNVTTGAPGSQAAASISGEAPEQILGLAIPQGLRGARGPAGNVKVERPAPGVWDIQPEELDVQIPDVTGLQAALDGKASTTDSRLSDARPPTAHTHTDLVARLAALEYSSGVRDITSLVPVAVASGRLLLWRTGSQVWLDFDTLQPSDASEASSHSWTGFLPPGFRPYRNFPMLPLAPQFGLSGTGTVSSSLHALGPVRPQVNGGVVIYGAKNASGQVRPIQGLISWPTTEAPPTTLPGTPA